MRAALGRRTLTRPALAGRIGTLCGAVGMLATVPAAATWPDCRRAWERLARPLDDPPLPLRRRL